MKANRKFINNKKGFTFLIPFTLAIVVSITLLIVGAFIVGTISTVLEDTFPITNNATSTYRSTNQNATVSLIGNITTGFASVVDIEIVVMIIVALSMAIFTVMALGTGKRAF